MIIISSSDGMEQ